jgi:hypothetical protein
VSQSPQSAGILFLGGIFSSLRDKNKFQQQGIFVNFFFGKKVPQVENSFQQVAKI